MENTDICEINCSGKASDKIAACQKLIKTYVRPKFLLHTYTNFLWNYSYGSKITACGFVSKLHDIPQPERQRSIETGALVTDTIKRRSVTVAQLLMDAGIVGPFAARCVTCHGYWRAANSRQCMVSIGANGDCTLPLSALRSLSSILS